MKKNVKIRVAELAVVLGFLVPFAVTPYQLPHHTFVPAIIGAFALPGLAVVFRSRPPAEGELVTLPPMLAWTALPITILIHAGALDELGVGIKAVVLFACVAGLGVLAAFAAAPLVATWRPSWGVTARRPPAPASARRARAPVCDVAASARAPAEAAAASASSPRGSSPSSPAAGRGSPRAHRAFPGPGRRGRSAWRA